MRSSSPLWFQFTHPGKGATTRWRGRRSPIHRFNSRTLGRVRQATRRSLRQSAVFQFTHPGKGATRRSCPMTSPGGCFNSRTLGRVRQLGDYQCRLRRWFQFTHPGKGATPHSVRRCEIKRFNSRTLGRVRPLSSTAVTISSQFQFTHPGKGATSAGESSLSKAIAVSIHAPWEGCDTLSEECVCIYPSFNSRTLGRVRPVEVQLMQANVEFQFTHPGKGATGRIDRY